MLYDTNILAAKRKRSPTLDEEDDEETEGKGSLGYYQRTHTSTLHRFHIDTNVGPAHIYRNMIQVLTTCTEHDEVEIFINTDGGYLDSTEALINAIRNCQATVTGYINTKAYSAGSMIALACHALVPCPRAKMMVHESSYGVGGKGSENKQQTDFHQACMKELLEDVYEGFLTPEEIVEVQNGKTFWIYEEEIIDRLNKRNEVFEKKIKQMEEASAKLHVPVVKKREPKPKAKSKVKKA